jgi:hypothetical protein
MELDAAKSVGPELKLHGTGTKIIDLFCLINRYLVNDHLYDLSLILKKIKDTSRLFHSF